jgi:hypothetical protein
MSVDQLCRPMRDLSDLKMLMRFDLQSCILPLSFTPYSAEFSSRNALTSVFSDY